MIHHTLAYLDAGTGSLVIQTLIAGVLTVGYYLRTRLFSLGRKSGS